MVKNAQEALGQSLQILQRAVSKVIAVESLQAVGTIDVQLTNATLLLPQEEQESARLQVNSQISRCEELLLKLKVTFFLHEGFERNGTGIFDVLLFVTLFSVYTDCEQDQKRAHFH